jgi:HEAT repeat protein
VRRLVVHALALGEIGSMAQLAVTSVVDVLHDEAEDEYLRCESVMCLPSLMPRERAGPLILEAAASQSANVRVSAFEAIGQVAVDPDRLLPLLSKSTEDPVPAIQAYSRTLRDENSDVRAAGLSALASMGTKAMLALPTVREALSDPDEGVREAARKAVQKISTRHPE